MNRPTLPILAASLLPTMFAALLLPIAGCAARTRVAVAPPPPPPPGYSEQAPPMLKVADHNGFQAGVDAGSRDAMSGRSYHPKHDRAFHDTPGYDPTLGPITIYRSAFRNAYLRGYDQGFHTPHGMQ
jgi:hypothetical protein